MRRLAGLVALAPLLAACASTLPPDSFFIAKAQARVDAVAVGDVQVWRDTLAADGVFVDEEDNVLTAKDLLGQLKPLPAGYSGHIELANPHFARSGDTVVMTADLLETETVFGQELHTKYRETDVWRMLPEGWRIIASHSVVFPSEAKPVGPPAPLTDFAGTYRLAPGQTVVISVSGDQLFTKRGEAAAEALIAIGGDHFIRKGRNRGERIFVRDKSGEVTGFLDRRDNVDMKWERVSS